MLIVDDCVSSIVCFDQDFSAYFYKVRPDAVFADGLVVDQKHYCRCFFAAFFFQVGDYADFISLLDF